MAARAEWEAIQFQIVKRLRMLQALESQRTPIHQRTTTIHADGSRTVKEEGSPLVWQSRLGLVAPIDDEHAVEEDRIYRRDDWTTSDVEGRTIAVSRLTSRPRVGGGLSLCASAELPLPSRAMLASAASFPVRMALEDLRARAISARRLRRKGVGVGEGVEPVGRPDGLSESFLCTGLPSASQPSPPDSAVCAGATPGTVTPFQDSRVAAINAYSYLDDRYHGAGKSAAGGLAAWAVGGELFVEESGYSYQSVPHIVIGVVEHSPVSFPDPLHKAFQTRLAGNRVRYFVGGPASFNGGPSPLIEAVDFASTISVTSLSGGTPAHGTACAGVAMANTTDNQDSLLTTSEVQDARSGVARRAYGVFSMASISDTLDFLQGAKDDSGNLRTIEGIDVLTSSLEGNSGSSVPNSIYDCPTSTQARGVDDLSVRITEAYLEDSIVCFKSAGNIHLTGNSSFEVACIKKQNIPNNDDSPFEVSAPGASPSIIAVGALMTGGIGSGFGPAGMQASDSLVAASAGGTTGDGRVYPSLVVPAYSCGVAGSDNGGAGGSYQQIYVQHGFTSGAAPTVAGATALFKHWYLDAHGPGIANQPGRVICNVLNMADGVAYSDWSGGMRANPRRAGWGLGRFRMRRYSAEHMSGVWLQKTAAVTLTTEEPVDLVWLSGATGFTVPSTVKRLVITLWWLEVNTGSGEPKADIDAYIYRTSGRSPGMIAWKQSRKDCKIRIQYDCYDNFFSKAPWGDLCLVVYCNSLPKESRNEGRDSRTIYVSWYWESGPDQSLILETTTQCPSPNPDHCEKDRFDEVPLFPATGLLQPGAARAKLNALERMVRVETSARVQTAATEKMGERDMACR